ncbi:MULTISPECIES: NAD-dependent epimerase/dehydratase family protein [unclassified Legionella]|uniref:NAD-dependent epimerase/dehydratase family protein n=1 Tax=unclassified Legionella TaxID=2622702 RepID=UPI0010568019|nr:MULTISPECIES: NAD-dependent epimerase/dehydratase family protein [unclassified Legionella]MDI9819349.1 NAD-dependent epimerase/dehydratase family protein [Legionella sp. PL877]
MGKYIVTGGAGFIGSHLTERLLAQGHKVIIIDNLSVGQHCAPDAHLVREDLRDYNAIKSFFRDIDGCFHLAAVPSVVSSVEDWFDLHNINLQAGLNILKLAHLGGNIPLVYASSCAVYGDAQTLPLTEAMHIKPISSYGCDKLSLELNAYFMAKSHSLPVMGLRFFNVYGPRQQPDSPYAGVISLFIENLLNDRGVTIYGDGQQTRDFIYVDDVVSGLIKAMQIVNSEAEVINLCNGKSITIQALAHETASLMKKKLCINYQPERSADVKHSLGSVKKMHQFGFSSKIPLATGLKETIKYMSEHQ